MDPKFKKQLYDLLDKDPSGLVSGLAVLAGLAGGLPDLFKSLNNPSYQPPAMPKASTITPAPATPAQPVPYTPGRKIYQTSWGPGTGASWTSQPLEDIIRRLNKSLQTPTTPSTTPTTGFAPTPANNTDFSKTQAAQYNKQNNIAFEDQSRWDEKRGEYISVGRFMKDQAAAQAKKAKHE